MSRALVQMNLWLLGMLMVIGLALVTTGVQAALRRAVPATSSASTSGVTVKPFEHFARDFRP